MGMSMKVILDTNIFVAAGFNKSSKSAELVRMVKDGELMLVWDKATKRETEKIIGKIPPLNWKNFENMFDKKHEYLGKTNPSLFSAVADKDDRKFAALAVAANAVLISNDDHLLSVRDEIDAIINTPGELVRKMK